MKVSLDKHKTEIPPLLKPPLLEAIVELHWELQKDPQTGRLKDPSYPTLYGQLYERHKKEYPALEDLPSVQMHPEAAPYLVRHRMRKKQDGYPLLQVGPGIATANTSKEYEWESFKEIASSLYRSIKELYPPTTALKFLKWEMRFLNAIPVDLEKEHPLSFLAEQLHLKIEPCPDLFTWNPMGDLPLALHLNLAYPLQKPSGVWGLGVHLGQVEGRPCYIMQTQVHSAMEQISSMPFDVWLEESHQVLARSFAALCKGDLMRKFGGG